jgi:hypothetical protein
VHYFVELYRLCLPGLLETLTQLSHRSCGNKQQRDSERFRVQVRAVSRNLKHCQLVLA